MNGWTITGWTFAGVFFLLMCVFFGLNLWNTREAYDLQQERDLLHDYALDMDDRHRELSEQHRALKDKDKAWYELNEERNLTERETDKRMRQLRREYDECKTALARYEQQYAPVNHTQPTTGEVVPEVKEPPAKRKRRAGQAVTTGEDGTI